MFHFEGSGILGLEVRPGPAQCAGLAQKGLVYLRKRRKTTAGLRQKFGPEYDRAVLTQGSKAETKLADREKRVEKLYIRDLDLTEHERFSKQW